MTNKNILHVTIFPSWCTKFPEVSTFREKSPSSQGISGVWPACPRRHNWTNNCDFSQLVLASVSSYFPIKSRTKCKKTRCNLHQTQTDLRLNVCDLAPAEFILVEWHTTLLQVAQESELFRPKDQQSMTTPTFTSCCPANSMNVLLCTDDIQLTAANKLLTKSINCTTWKQC